MHTITLTRNNLTWNATHSNPRIKELFGTDTLATPFTSYAAPTYVLEQIQALNLDAIVTIKQ